MSLPRFEDRRAAGRELGERLRAVDGHDAVVFGIARGGVPVAYEVASALGAPLEVFVSRRLHSPRGIVLGAIAETGSVWLDRTADRLPEAELSELIMRESLAVDRQARSYRQHRTRYSVEGRRVVLVDDGLVTGATALAAISALRALGARKLVLAVPVADGGAVAAVRPRVEALLALHVPEELGRIGRWYRELKPVSDGELQSLLQKARAPAEAALDAAVP